MRFSSRNEVSFHFTWYPNDISYPNENFIQNENRNDLIKIIIYSIYRALIPNGPKNALHNKNNNKILNLQNYIVIL